MKTTLQALLIAGALVFFVNAAHAETQTIGGVTMTTAHQSVPDAKTHPITSFDVMEAQKTLNEKGNKLVVDGVVGPETSSALTKYQQDYRLEVTGTLTEQTLSDLKVRNPVQD